MTEKPTTRKTKNWKQVFLESFKLNGTVAEAAKIAGIGRTWVYETKKEDPDFAKAFDEAAEVAADALEREAWRRALEGTDEPVIHQGKLCSVWVNDKGEHVPENTPGAKPIPLTLKKRSDVLLIFILKGRRPEIFGDRMNLTQKGDFTLRNPADGAAQADVLIDRLRERLGVAKPAEAA